MAEIEATVNNLQRQLTAVQAAIEGNAQASMFKPRPFTGALSEDVNEWLAKFDRFAKFYNWGNAKRLGALVLLFEGPALSWFQTLPEETAAAQSPIAQENRIKELEGQVNLLLSMASNKNSCTAPSLNPITGELPPNALNFASYFENPVNYSSNSEIQQVKSDIIAAIQNSA
eukprot:gene16268-17908_t